MIRPRPRRATESSLQSDQNEREEKKRETPKSRKGREKKRAKPPQKKEPRPCESGDDKLWSVQSKFVICLDKNRKMRALGKVEKLKS